MANGKTSIQLIQEIQRIRKSRVVTVITGDRPGFTPNMQMLHADALRHIYELTRDTWKKSPADRLDLFLYTRGGDSDFPWALMSMLREIIDGKELNVLIPYRCHSAGTIAALGADEIVMGPKAELGPIDTTMNTPYNPAHPKSGEPLPISVEDVMGYFSLLEKVGCTGSDNKVEGLKAFTNKVHPYALGMVQRLEDQTKLVAGQMLASRLQPFSIAENEAIVSTLAKRINSHRHVISRTEALKQVGLKSVKRSEEADLPLWDLFLAYEQMLKLATTFYPEDDFWKDENLESKEYEGVPCCCIETELALKVCKFDVRLTRTREAIQSLTVQPQISFPPPQLPADMDQNQIMQFIQTWYAQVAPQLLQQAVLDAVEKARKSTPTIGFQRMEHRRRWEDGQPELTEKQEPIDEARRLVRQKPRTRKK